MPPEQIWRQITEEVKLALKKSPRLKPFFEQTIFQQNDLCAALSFILTEKLQFSLLPRENLLSIMHGSLQQHKDTAATITKDLLAIYERDSACTHYYQPLCFYKGFHALSAYRVTHMLWQQKQKALAYLLQNRISSVLDVDIHPAAQIGHGIMLDHATGIVIGETAIIGNNVSIMQSVTLGGTGKESGDRHPKIGDGVLISVGAKILGNITIGEGAQISAGSVVLKPVAAHTTVAGVPAKVVGTPRSEQPALIMEHKI